MNEYQFRTTKEEDYVSQVIRLQTRVSGLILPYGMLQITYQNGKEVQPTSDIYIPNETDVASLGQLTLEPTQELPQEAIDKYSFIERDISIFGQKALETCLLIMDGIEVCNLQVVVNQDTVHAERDFIETFAFGLRQHTTGTNKDVSKRLHTGQYL